MTDAEPILLSPVQAAKRLGISRAQLYVLMKQGEIPTLWIGRSRRITPGDLDAFVKRKQREARRRVAADRKQAQLRVVQSA